MRKFDYKKLSEKSWDNEILLLCSKIHECKGRQDLFVRQKPTQLDRLVEISKIQSTEASNRIEGIVTTSTRMKQLFKEKTTPKNRDEKEILGYRDVLNTIHESHDYIDVSPNHILQLHRDLLKRAGFTYSGHFKNTQNYIKETKLDGTEVVRFTPLAPYETPDAVGMICRSFSETLAMENVDPLILIPAFICDFLCIHPFNDGNGRMSRLLTTLLLYRSGFYVGKYISLEAKIAKNKDLYYDALAASQDGWHEGQAVPIQFVKYLLGTILSAYRDFADRFAIVETKHSAIEKVRMATQNKIGRFTKQDIREQCPSLSISSVESALRNMVASGELKREGTGKNTCYFRLK